MESIVLCTEKLIPHHFYLYFYTFSTCMRLNSSAMKSRTQQVTRIQRKLDTADLGKLIRHDREKSWAKEPFETNRMGEKMDAEETRTSWNGEEGQ